jgi:hypothetical protein
MPRAVTLSKAIICNSSYVVNANNNTFGVIYSATTYLITIPVGNYNAAQLATAVQTALTGAIGAVTWTVTANSTTNKFMIGGSASFAVNFANSKYCARLLGFNPVISSAATSQVAPNCYTIANTPYYQLRLHEIPVLGDSGYMATVMNNASIGGFSYSGHVDITTIHNLPPITLQQIRLSVHDSDGNLIDLNGGSVMVELQFAL